MTTVLQVRDRAIQADELIPLLQDYQLLPKLRRELAIDEAIVAVTCTPQEQEMLSKQFFAQQNIPVDADQQFYRDRYGMTSEQMLAPLIRGLRIEKFKRAKWGMKLELYFLKRKADLDRVMFSLIRHPNRELMQELYFRLVEGEQSFTELAILYSQGVEAQTQGIFGPIELGQLHPILAKLLITSQPGQVRSPVEIDGQFMLFRIEALLPAQLDEAMQQRLLNEQFEQWLCNVKLTKL